MNRHLLLNLNKVTPTPAGLRDDPSVDSPTGKVTVNLGQLYHHYYLDGFPSGPPAPDPSRFEYLDHIAADNDFRFLSYVADASTTRKRSISTEMGQALCRWMLDVHFGIKYFAHMSRVIDKRTHPGFGRLQIRRIAKGDVPDYLCARKVTEPMIAEAKGRFSAVSFANGEFKEWRAQFDRIQASDGGAVRKLKGYVVATRFSTESSPRTYSQIYVEDPDTPGQEPFGPEQGVALGRAAAAFHYAQVLRKLGLHLLASGLENGSGLARELTFHVPVWTCLGTPMQGKEFVGGFYQTLPGEMPQLTSKGWEMPIALGRAHAVFVGLERSVAVQVAQAARGRWSDLDDLPDLAPRGSWSSEFSWLRDGTVLAPLEYFAPSGLQPL